MDLVHGGERRGEGVSWISFIRASCEGWLSGELREGGVGYIRSSYRT
jgi:hypothetical protein